MTNFQRSRSKVWWGDSPPNIGSPLPRRELPNKIEESEEDWEPQLPHLSPPLSDRMPETGESPPLPPLNVWSPRQSPGSHKSQDSGFSDSDTSPSNNQEKGQKKETPKEEPRKECCPEEKCCGTPRPVAQSPKTPRQGMSKFYLDTPKNLIKTPKDIHDYLQASCDIGHASVCSKIHSKEDIKSIKMLQNDANKIVVTPHKSVNNNNVIIEKYSTKRLNFKDDDDNKSTNIQYIQISPSHQIAVNNQARVRSPVTRVNCYSESKQKDIRRDDNFSFAVNGGTTHYFQRNGMNRSVNFSERKYYEEDDEGSHSLGYIEYLRAEEITRNRTPNQKPYYAREDLRCDTIIDTLNLKTPKKTKRKSKQSPKSLFGFLPKKADNFKTIHDITSAFYTDRVPSLGLPNFNDSNEERAYLNNSQELDCPKGILKTPGTVRKITPPLQFRDPTDIFSPRSQSKKEIKNERSPRNSCSSLSSTPDKQNFGDFDPTCISTPKSLSKTPHFDRKPGEKLKPVNLLANFNGSLDDEPVLNPDDGESIKSAINKVGQGQIDSVKHWLHEMAEGYEPECITTLQSKAIGTEVAAKIANSSATITGNIRKVQTHGQIIAHQYKQIIRYFESTSSFSIEDFREEIETLMSNINEFILTHSITLKIKPPGETPDRWDKIKIALQNNIQKVIEISEDVNLELNETCPEINVLSKHLATLLDIFTETARAVLVQQMKTLITILEDPPSDLILKSTLTSLGHLGALMSPDKELSDVSLEAMDFITELPFVECEVPRALLSVIIESNKSSIKALCLRALATICINSETVKQFEEAGGIEIISDILQEQSNPEPQMREAVTLLTQVTAPWLSGDYYITELEVYLNPIVKNITALIIKTSCCQLLLLCTACFVNITMLMKQKYRMNSINVDPKVIDVIQIFTQHQTVESLLEAVKKRGPNASVFLQEQTATLINLISTSSKGRIMLANCPAVSVALVCFLRIPRASPSKPANLQAEFRLVTQATEALSRLCMIPEITARLIQLEGVTRLVTVIQGQKQQSKEGKSSDQILVNCLRALRAVVKINKECLKGVDCDVTDMIMPNLMDSVKIYSAKQESYV